MLFATLSACISILSSLRSIRTNTLMQYTIAAKVPIIIAKVNLKTYTSATIIHLFDKYNVGMLKRYKNLTFPNRIVEAKVKVSKD